MSNQNIYLKYSSSLQWSSTESGPYVDVGPNSPSTGVEGGDTITFIAVSGIDKIQKISDGLNGTKKLIKSKKGEDSNTVIATIDGTVNPGDIDKYEIKFKPDHGGSITVDPEIEVKGT